MQKRRISDLGIGRTRRKVEEAKMGKSETQVKVTRTEGSNKYGEREGKGNKT